jgi:hypothetical protein
VTEQLQASVLREAGVSAAAMHAALAFMRAAPYTHPALMPLCLYHRHQRAHTGPPQGSVVPNIGLALPGVCVCVLRGSCDAAAVTQLVALPFAGRPVQGGRDHTVQACSLPQHTTAAHHHTPPGAPSCRQALLDSFTAPHHSLLVLFAGSYS